MAKSPDAPLLEEARAALGRHDWRDAFDALSAADAREPLTPQGLELLAQAAWWTGQLPVAIDARERAYAAARRTGDSESALIAAINLARDYLFRMAMPMATAWIGRAEQLLEGVPENPGHGWLAGVRAFHAVLTGDLDEALADAERARQVGRKFELRDLEAFGLSEKAAVLLATGKIDEGLKLADEATLAAVSGELEPFTAGGVCCATIEACAGIGDIQRAAEWTEAQDRWCRREGINGYPGMCRLFRSEVKAMRGDWPEAEAEARLASNELLGFIPAAAGLALYQIGEIRLRRGDLPAAEEALLGAHARGHAIEPANSLLRLAQGKVDSAAASIKIALAEPGRTPSWRAPPSSEASRLRLLPAQVEIGLAAGDLPTARTAADGLAELAERIGTLPARAAARAALGSVALAEGDAPSAAQYLRSAIADWTELNAPFELARTRLALGDAYLADGAHDLAAIEVRTARDGFEQLGAALDLRRAEASMAALMGESGGMPAMGTSTVRASRAFMFTDIVDSTRLAEGLGDRAWDTLLRRHDRTLRAATAEHGGEEVKATGDGFFLAFADVHAAIEAAIDIQRRLAARQGSGPAMDVRIGIHQAEANRVGLDYVGIGVNQAARIGSAANGGEILVSASSLEAVRHPIEEAGRRTLELKGLAAPVEVVAVDWG